MCLSQPAIGLFADFCMYMDVDYPVTKKTIQEFANSITNAVLSKRNITFVFKPSLGGERAWIKFILNCKDKTDLHQKLKNYSIVYYEPSEALEESKLGFFYLFLEKLNENSCTEIPKFEEASLSKTILLIKQTIKKQIKTKPIIIFMSKFSAANSFDTSYGNLLYSIWKEYKMSLFFVITMSPNDYEQFVRERCGEFCEVIAENTHFIDHLNKKDIDHSISHWENILKTHFSDKERKLIIKHSNGSPYISKALCQLTASKEYTGDLSKAFSSLVKQRFYTLPSEHSIRFNKKTGEISLGSKNITHDFSPKEQLLLSLLIVKKDKLVTRDDIAHALWGNKYYEKYSDWAIDKLISLIRKKLQNLGYRGEIVTMYGKGFKLI